MKKLKSIFDVFVYKIKSIFNKRHSFSAVIYNSKVSENAAILKNVRFYNSSVSDYSYIGRNSLIQKTNIGKFCSISENCNIGMPSHSLDYMSTSPVFLSGSNCLGINLASLSSESMKETEIKNDVWIGEGVKIKSGLIVGNGAVIGAGSVVTRNVPDYAIVAGTPAKIIRYRFDEKTRQELSSSEWWNLDQKKMTEFLNKFNDTLMSAEKKTK